MDSDIVYLYYFYLYQCTAFVFSNHTSTTKYMTSERSKLLQLYVHDDVHAGKEFTANIRLKSGTATCKDSITI